jgi:hypothetical protein
VIALDRLAMAALGELDDDEVEEHVLACSRCAAIFASFVRLGPAIAELVRGGGVSVVATASLVDRFERESLVSRRYVLAPGSTVPCAVGADDVYSCTTLEADLSGVGRVDLVRGPTRIADVPFDARGVRLLTRSDFLRTLPSMKIPFRLIAVEPGAERTIAEYTLDHTAFAG